MYSRGVPATSIVKRPPATAAVDPQPLLGIGAPAAAGSFVWGGAIGWATGGVAFSPEGVSPTLAGTPSGRGAAVMPLGPASAGVPAGTGGIAGGSPMAASVSISVGERAALAPGSLLPQAMASVTLTR